MSCWICQLPAFGGVSAYRGVTACVPCQGRLKKEAEGNSDVRKALMFLESLQEPRDVSVEIQHLRALLSLREENTEMKTESRVGPYLRYGRWLGIQFKKGVTKEEAEKAIQALYEISLWNAPLSEEFTQFPLRPLPQETEQR